MGREPITAERLRELLFYEPETGYFHWRKTPRGHKPSSGTKAGFNSGIHGYIKIGIDGGKYYAHRLAWLYVHGRWPTRSIDHANGNTADNRLCNLREATMSQNIANANFNKNPSGYRGIHVGPNGRWRAQIQAHGKRIHIGVFDTAEEAGAAYQAASIKYFGEFARVSSAQEGRL